MLIEISYGAIFFDLQLRIEAYDLGLPTPLSSDLDLTVYVQNVDNYRPRFPDRDFFVNITENVKDHGVYLPSVVERDPIDRGDEPILPVCYYIVRGNEDGMFELDRSTHRYFVCLKFSLKLRLYYLFSNVHLMVFTIPTRLVSLLAEQIFAANRISSRNIITISRRLSVPSLSLLNIFEERSFDVFQLTILLTFLPDWPPPSHWTASRNQTTL